MIAADEFKKLIDFAFEAYQKNNTSGQEYRQDGKVPYIMHPLWCASILITDTRIPYEERERGFKALILHDVYEDTNLDFPDWVEPDVKAIVKELTFESSDHALALVQSKPINIKLLLLVDGLSSMYEEHVEPQRRKKWKAMMEIATKEVEEHYGNIRVVQLAKSIIENTNW
jgi:(p)ppGpp synthase/HD superfamily hydrolase